MSGYSAIPREAGQGNLSSLFIHQVMEIFGVTRGDLYSKKRGDVTLARWAIAYLHREHLGWTYDRIGSLFSKDHTFSIYAYTQASILIHEDVHPFTEVVRMVESKNGY